MEDDSPGLGVGFAIDAGGSFEMLRQLETAMDSTEAKIVKEASSIERATAGMINLGGATAAVTTFGNATTREMQNVIRDKARAERAGERLVRQLEREIDAFGKTKAELRQMRAEEAALAAERTGNSDLARRIREQESELWAKEAFAARQAAIAKANAAEDAAAAEARAVAMVNAQLLERNRLQAALDRTMGTDRARATDAGATFSALAAREADAEAASKNAAAAATERLAREHAQLAAELQASYAAQQSNAAAAERIRLATDPLYAATSRLNAEIEESTRLYLAGATAPAEYARQQEVLTARLRDVTAQHERANGAISGVGGTGKIAGHHMQNLAFQFQDLGLQMAAAAGSSDPLKMGLMAVMQQGTQIQGIMSQAGIGVRGVAGAFASMTKSVLLAAAANPVLWALGAAAAFVAVGFGDLKKSVADDSGMAAYAKSAGLTKAELEKLGDTGLSVGDVFRGLWRTFDEATGIADTFGEVKDAVIARMQELVRGTGREIAAIYGFFVGAYDAIIATWNRMPGALGDVFVQAVNAAVTAINALVQKSVAGMNWVIEQANKVLPEFAQLGRLSVGTIGSISNQWAGQAAAGGEAVGQAFSSGFSRGVAQVEALAERIYNNILGANQDRVRKAVQGILDDRRETRGRSPRAERLSDEEKAALKAAEAAREYALAQLDEAAKVGLSTKELRLHADALAIAKAPTDALKQAIREAAAVREDAYSAQSASDFQNNVMKPLQDELALQGLVGAARDRAALALERNAFIAANMDAGLTTAIERWREYYRVKSELIDGDEAAEKEVERIKQIRDEVQQLVDASRAAGSAMAQAFGKVGDAIADVLDVFTVYAARRKELDAEVLAGTKTQAQADSEAKDLQIQSYGALAGSAKQFFAEGSAGYQAMAAAEKAFALVQLANTAVNVAAGASKMFASLGPFAFPVVAAMLAVMAGLGFGGGRGSSGYVPPTADDLQAAAGTGTVLGDTRAQSNSIANSLEIMASNSNSNLEYSNQMLRALKAIESGIGNLSGVIARQITVSGSMFDTSGLNIGQSGSAGFLGLFSSSTTRSLYDAGIDLAARTVGDIVAQGITGSTYQIVQQVRRTSGFLGIGGGTRTTYQTTTGALDGDITAAIVDVIASLRAGLIEGADQLGIAGAQALLDSFQVNIGRVSFAGMTGDEIEQQLNAIFSRVGDEMAAALYPQIAAMQQIGEGAFETFMRVSRQYQVVDTALASIGRTFGAVGLESVQARDALIQLFGTMEDFVERTTFFAEKFLTEQERLAPVQAAVSAELARLGMSQITTMEQFKQAVLGLDLTTEAGREMYAALMALAPAFAALHQSASEVLSERVDLERRLLELQGNTAALRARDLALLDPSNRALQQQIWALEDAQEAARAAEQLRDAWASVGDSIMDEVNRIRALTGTESAGGFASAQGQFNAAVAAAQAGDIDAARSLPGLSQALLRAAEQQATSRQELDRIRAQTAATLEQLFASINGATPATPGAANADLADAAGVAQVVATGQDTVSLSDELAVLREEVAGMRAENNAGHAATASNTGAIKRSLENVTAESGGDAISTRVAA